MQAPRKPDSGPAPSRLVRARQMGLSGLQASTMGLVMVGCITVGFLLGQWLDARFHTTYWMPVLVVLGVIAGFREMFRTVVSINRQSQSLLEESRQERRERAERSADDLYSAGYTGQSGTESAATDVAYSAEPGEAAEVQQPRPRVFKVPPPPQPSFARRAANESGDASGGNAAISKIDKQGADAGAENAPDTAGSGDEPLMDTAAFTRLTEDVDVLKRLLDDDQGDDQQASRPEK